MPDRQIVYRMCDTIYPPNLFLEGISVSYLKIGGAGGGTLVPNKGITSKLIHCYCCNHACAFHVNTALNGQ